MAHCMKFTRAACGHMFKHFERAKDENGEYVKFGNENINLSLTKFNYNLAPDRGISQGEFVRRRCSEVYCLNRKDVNVMCSWVVTLPQDFDFFSVDEFMEETYKFLSARYGEENVISAYVHMDEVNPHMHFAFVPVTYDKKKGLYKVSACEVINRTELKTFHEALEADLRQKLGCKVNILNGATKNGNRAIRELKKGTAIKKIVEADEKIQKKRDIAQKIEDRTKDLAQKLDTLSRDYDAVKRKCEERKERADKWTHSEIELRFKCRDLEDQCDSMRKECDEIREIKDKLEHDVLNLSAKRVEIEDSVRKMQDKRDEIQRICDILSDRAEEEYNQTRFKPLRGSNASYYHKRGELIALYTDGRQRIVGENEYGGFDRQTLADEESGICRVGIFDRERSKRVPETLLRELLAVRDREMPISENLKRLIKQEIQVKNYTKLR